MNLKDSMRSRRLLIKARLRNNLLLIALIQKLQRLMKSLHLILSQLINEHAPSLINSYFQALLRLVQQVIHILIIDLHILHFHLILHLLIVIIL